MKLCNHQMILLGGPGLNSNRFKTEYGDDRTPERGFEFQLAGRIDRETFPHIFGNLAIQRKGITAVAEISPWSTHDNHATCLRIALGAERWDVMRMILYKGGKLMLIGTGIGVVGALLMSRILSSLVVGVSERDPLTFVGVPLFLALVALIATYVPAFRAARVDPMQAMRTE